MKTYSQINDIKRDFPNTRFGITIGNFDGVHLGHRNLIHALMKSCKDKNLTPMVLSFSPHPREIFEPNLSGFYLTDANHKARLIESLGVEVYCELAFTKNFSELTAENFFKNYISSPLKVESLVLGYDFRFGSNKDDSVDFLKNDCHQNGMSLSIHTPYKVNEDIVSSSLIRDLINKGDITKANELLGRSFSLKGKVIEGQKRGRTIEVPTANQLIPKKIMVPKKGVYASKVYLGEKVYLSVTNIGNNPTFGDENPKTVETHIFDYSGDLYGEIIEVEFLWRVRDEITFSSSNELKDQILKDIELVRKRFS